jgi:hypothetical protein
MTRNNADFYASGINPSDGGFHFANKKHRSSIESSGLKKSPEGKGYKQGVYVYNGHQDAETMAGTSHPNSDIYQVHVPVNHLNRDPMLKNVASYSDSDVPARYISRVGHTTSDGEIHWHPEESC